MLQLSVVVPCRNEVDTITELHRRLQSVLDGLNLSYEVILIDDGSTDATWETIQSLHQNDPSYVGIRLTRNFGHQKALTAGLDMSRGEQILILDADLQDPPELLPQMLELSAQGYDVVLGKRQERRGESWFKRASASLFYRIVNRLSDRPLPQDVGDFRLMSRRALEALKSMPEYHRFIRGMVSWVGFPQVELKYRREARWAGQTNYPFRKMVAFAIDAITSFSIRPLTLASYAGFFSGLVGAALLVYSIYAWLHLNTVPGWTSVICVMAIFSSVQLFVLGVIGEYLGRLYEQSKNRPLYLIQEICNGKLE